MADMTVAELWRVVEGLRREVDVLNATVARLQASRPELQPGAAAASVGEGEANEETLVLIAAVVTAYLGKKVRVRSARLVPPGHEAANLWGQQSRVFGLAASHDLRRVR